MRKTVEHHAEPHFTKCDMFLGLGVVKCSRLHFWIKILFQGQKYMLTEEHI